MLKVAHVIRVFSYGGAEISLKEILSTESFRHNIVSDLSYWIIKTWLGNSNPAKY